MTSDKHCPLFCREVNDHLLTIYLNSEKHDSSKILETWLRRAPRYTTVRVNFPTVVEEAMQELQKVVDNAYSVRDKYPPKVYKHHTLKDLLVIPSPAHEELEIQSNKEVIVDVHCGAAVLRGADIFAPGVLAAPSDLRSGDWVSVYADLASKCLKGSLKTFPGPKLFIGNGVATCSRQDLFVNNSIVSGIAVIMKDTTCNCPPLGDNVLGKSMFLQNLPSVLCSHVLSPKPSEIVLDMCAAPGGKTTHIASIMQNSGFIIALDKSSSRVEKLKSNIALSGYSNIHAFACDARKAVNVSIPDVACEVSNSSFVPVPPPYPPGLFDCILLDAPCSALGQRPQLANKMTLKELQAFPQLQRKLFSVATQLLKPGGKLVYSTCSLSIEENEEIVSWALAKYSELELDEQVPYLGGQGQYVPGLQPDHLKKLQRFDLNSPGEAENSDTIGFFIAKFKKKTVF